MFAYYPRARQVYEQPRDGDKKLKICCQVLTSSTQPQNRDVISCLGKDDKDGEMYKNARAERAKCAKLQFSLVNTQICDVLLVVT